jgi:type IX secretion system PorP/SprF family membrane protein
MKRSLTSFITILSFLAMGLSAAAQDVDYTQYYLNNAAYNPGFTGMEDFVDVKVGFRQGWNTFAIPNNYMFFSLNSGLNSTRRSAIGSNSLRISNAEVLHAIQNGKKIRRKHGLGTTLAGRKLGPFSLNTLSAHYAYHLPISRQFTLAFGSRVGIQSQRIRLDGYRVRDEANDQLYKEIMRSGQGNSMAAVVDFGYVLYSRNFNFGISSMNLIRSDMGSQRLVESAEQRVFLAQASFTGIPMGKNLVFSPGARFAYTPNGEPSLNINSRFAYKKLVYVGAGFSNTGKKVSGLFGLRIEEKLTIHYSYDKYISHLNNFNTNVHEIVVGIHMFNKYGVEPKLW